MRPWWDKLLHRADYRTGGTAPACRTCHSAVPDGYRNVLIFRYQTRLYPFPVPGYIPGGGGGIDYSLLRRHEHIYGNQYNPDITLKSLAYFDEGNVTELSEMIREDLVKAIKNVRLENIPTIKSSCKIGEDLDQGMRL